MRLLLGFIFVTASLFVHGQELKVYQAKNPKNDPLVGLMDANGNKLTERIYDFIQIPEGGPAQSPCLRMQRTVTFKSGSSPAYMVSLMGFLDRKGKEVGPPQYKEIAASKHSGYAFARRDGDDVYPGWVIINPCGEEVFRPDSLEYLTNQGSYGKNEQISEKTDLILKGGFFVTYLPNPPCPSHLCDHNWRMYDIEKKTWQTITEHQYNVFVYGEEEARRRMEVRIKAFEELKNTIYAKPQSNPSTGGAPIYFVKLEVKVPSGVGSRFSSQGVTTYYFTACVESATISDPKTLANKVWNSNAIHFYDEMSRNHEALPCKSADDCAQRGLDFAQSHNSTLKLVSLDHVATHVSLEEHKHVPGLLVIE